MIVLNKSSQTLGVSPKFPPLNRSVLFRRMKNGGGVMIVLPSRSSGILHSGGARSAAELLRNSAACALSRFAGQALRAPPVRHLPRRLAAADISGQENLEYTSKTFSEQVGFTPRTFCR